MSKHKDHSKETKDNDKDRPKQMCKLLHKGQMEELDRRSSQPTVICNKCGAKANDKHDVCSPRKK